LFIAVISDGSLTNIGREALRVPASKRGGESRRKGALFVNLLGKGAGLDPRRK
jgi:hypothetical protein